MISNKIKKGYIMLLTTIIFMLVSVIIVLGISTPTVKQILLSRDTWGAKQSYYLTESGVEDVMYRLKNSTFSSNVGSTETLTMDGYNAVTQIANNITSKTITTQSNENGYKKSIMATVDEGAGTSFSYGILTGQGGFYLGGGSHIYGNIYSDGDITGESGTTITGSAIAASSGIGYFKDQSNETPTSTSNYIVFNDLNTRKDFAQSFQVSTTSPLGKIRFYMKRIGSPNSFSVSLINDSSGIPGATVLASATLGQTDASTTYGWVDINFTTNPTLTKNTTYWVVIIGENTWGSDSSYYSIAANTSYSNGQAKLGVLSSNTWGNTSPSGLDALLAVFLGLPSGQITCAGTSCLTIGSSSTDMVWASKVSGVSSPGTIYANVDTNNNKGSIERDNPPVIPMTITADDITAWKAQAAAGGTYNGNLSVDYTGDIRGPLKITGNLYVTSGTLLVTGTLWVQGNITVTSGGKIIIDPSLGDKSVIIVTDSYVSIDGGAQFQGSGTAGSYPIVVTTSVCPNTSPCASNNAAIYLSGGAGAVVLTAPYGEVFVGGGSGARSISGNLVHVDNGASVTYETGLANLSFSSGPTGGWAISGWGEIEN
jgi:hypothetical protein